MADANITARRVREVLSYDSETGAFTRLARLAQRHQVGDRADFLVTGGGAAGYRRVAIDSRRFLAHRVAWLYVHGAWPSRQIDHINGDRGDNRIANLRDASPKLNVENQRRARADSAIGMLGVHLHKQSMRWISFCLLRPRNLLWPVR